LLLLSVTVSVGCHGAAPRLVARKTPVVTGMVTEHCRDCHMRSVSDQVPEALAVFDLDNPDWFAGIPQESWCAFLSRLLPHADAKKDRELRAVIDAELARRQRAIRPSARDQPVDTMWRLCPSIYSARPS
jgi:hypothetical protein